MQNNNDVIYNILRMINNCPITTDEIKKFFDSSELEIIKNLYMDESIFNVFNKEKGIETISLTKKGKFKLFNEDNKDQITKFGEELEEKGYNASYLGDYLKTCNLNDDLNNIFSISNFDIFMHNIKLLSNNSSIARRIMIRNRNIG